MEPIELIAKGQKASGMPLAERLSGLCATPSPLAGDFDGGRFPPLDRLDLLESGRLLIGTDAGAGLPRPCRAELLGAGAEFAESLAAGVAPGHRHTCRARNLNLVELVARWLQAAREYSLAVEPLPMDDALEDRLRIGSSEPTSAPDVL